MADVTEYKCTSCGAPMKYDINEKRMVCTFCSNSYNLEYIRSHFNEVTDKKLLDFDWVERTKYVWEPDMLEQLEEYTCSSCGGNIITKNTSASARCPFCNHEVVISSNFSGDIRPDKVIPFEKKAEEFAENYRQNIASARYAPKAFRDPSVTDNIIGCYIPIWLYSCTCDSGVNSSSVNFKITDYPILGTDIKKDIFYSVVPFNYDKAEVFTESCLTGFYASRYSIGAENAMEFADAEIKKVCFTRAAILSDGDYYSSTSKENSIISNKKLYYYLVPIWFLNVSYKGKDYTFAMNGQTGQFASPDVPYNFRNKIDFLLTFFVIELLAFILGYICNKDSKTTVADALFISFLLTVFFSSFFVYIAAGIIHYKFSKKSIGGLRNGKNYYDAGVKSYIDEEIEVNRINNRK
ncbi:hypothetical protein [Ruminococcus sp.]|uniref:hypothetical protein n=1 Tax=Ruminococcus sp. TaxID=41978 RepID=UPI0025F32B30|nr:hypothetical protein [Ruminococcus sp.]